MREFLSSFVLVYEQDVIRAHLHSITILSIIVYIRSLKACLDSQIKQTCQNIDMLSNDIDENIF
jgi:hypothetical protein